MIQIKAHWTEWKLCPVLEIQPTGGANEVMDLRGEPATANLLNQTNYQLQSTYLSLYPLVTVVLKHQRNFSFRSWKDALFCLNRNNTGCSPKGSGFECQCPTWQFTSICYESPRPSSVLQRHTFRQNTHTHKIKKLNDTSLCNRKRPLQKPTSSQNVGNWP